MERLGPGEVDRPGRCPAGGDGDEPERHCGRPADFAEPDGLYGNGERGHQYQIISIIRGRPADGSLTNNGVPIAVGTPTALSSLSGLQYAGGAMAGTDYVWLDAYNGPVERLGPGEVDRPWRCPAGGDGDEPERHCGQPADFAEPDGLYGNGSGVSQYQIIFDYPGTTADGSLTNNGVPIAVGTPTALSSLSGLQYTGGALAGTDLVWLTPITGSGAAGARRG